MQNCLCMSLSSSMVIRFRQPIIPRLKNEGVNEAVRKTYLIIKANPGLRVPQIAGESGKSISTIERHISILRKKGLVEHRDSDKAGGYYAK